MWREQFAAPRALMPSRATMGSPNPARDQDRDGWEVASSRSADSYGGRLGRPSRFDDMQGVPRLDGGRRSLTPQDCEFLFVGGAGVGGDYLDGFRRAFEHAGIENVRVPNAGAPDPFRDGPRIAVDAISVPAVNDLRFAKTLVGSPEVKAAAAHSRTLGDEQYNLGGYSYGAAAMAAQAYAIAESGGVVDNLVLVGAPINRDLYDAVKRHPNIRKVINVDLDAYGDPVHAGMSDLDIVSSVPTLAAQILKNEGHFRYSGSGPEYDRRRAELINLLTSEGLR